MLNWLTRHFKSESPYPSWQRLRNRAHRMFSAGQTDRLTSGWQTTPLSADQIINKNQRVLVARSREQVANNDYAKAFIRLARQNIVGPKGVMLQVQSVDDEGKLLHETNQAIESAWAQWGEKGNCDVKGQQSFRALQGACITSAVKDGEFMLRMVYGEGPWGFALQTIDPQRCSVDLNEDMGNGRFIRQGIEHNSYGRPLAYYFSTLNEQESEYQYGGRAYLRVPAEEILHGFLPEMEGQRRGLPWMATSLSRLKHLNSFEESALVNARVGANKMGFIQWREASGQPSFEDGDEILIDSKAGEFPVLPYGAELKEWSPNYPTGEFLPFYKTMLRGISSGFGVLYNNLASDLEGVNFSSIRQGTLDEREHWKELQEWLIESLVEPVYRCWLKVALLNGQIKLNGYPLSIVDMERYQAVTWQARRWAWIDPRADVEAAVSAKNNLLTSPGRLIREQGQDPQTMWAESARDVKAMMDAYIKEGIEEKVAAELVLLSMGQGKRPVGRPRKDEDE